MENRRSRKSIRQALGGRPPVLFEATPAEDNSRTRLEPFVASKLPITYPATNASGYRLDHYVLLYFQRRNRRPTPVNNPPTTNAKLAGSGTVVVLVGKLDVKIAGLPQHSAYSITILCVPLVVVNVLVVGDAVGTPLLMATVPSKLTTIPSS